MSSSSSVTVINVQNFQPLYDSLNLGPVPPGTTPDALVAKALKAIGDSLSVNWPEPWPPFDSTQVDTSIMQPWGGVVAGSAPKCVTDKITLDFKAWGFPVDQTMITQMAQEVTQHVVDSAGLPGVFNGKARRGSTTLFWRVAYNTGIVADDPETQGIYYGFCAVEA